MKKKISFFISFFALVSLIFASATDLLKYPVDIRSAGIANITTTFQKGDIWAIFNNQSVLAEEDHKIIGTYYSRMFNQFNLFSFAYGLPSRKGYAGFSATFLNYGKAEAISGVDLSTGLPISSRDFAAYDLLFNAGYANVIPFLGLNYGLSVKLLENSIDRDKTTYLVADGNILKIFDKGYILGLNIRNAGFGINDNTDVPFYLALGSTIPIFSQKKESPLFYLLNEVRYYVLQRGQDFWEGSLAVKYNYQDKLDVSFGVFLSESNPYIIHLGSLGVSYFWKTYRMRFDYAMNVQNVNVGLTHQLSLSYYFNQRVKGVRRTYKLSKPVKHKEDATKIKKEEQKLFKTDTEENEKFAPVQWSDED